MSYHTETWMREQEIWPHNEAVWTQEGIQIILWFTSPLEENGSDPEIPVDPGRLRVRVLCFPVTKYNIENFTKRFHEVSSGNPLVERVGSGEDYALIGSNKPRGSSLLEMIISDLTAAWHQRLFCHKQFISHPSYMSLGSWVSFWEQAVQGPSETIKMALWTPGHRS